jgi:phenylpyruvate tautomerase PptA (4-oxalocrotonate tautomerase family)
LIDEEIVLTHCVGQQNHFVERIMAAATAEKAQLKKAVREVLFELLKEDQELLHAIITEAAEDWMLGKLIEQERNSKRVSRRTIFKILEGRE